MDSFKRDVMITGATGLIGSPVAEEFKKNNWKVLCIGYKNYFSPRRETKDFRRVDVTDTMTVTKIFRECKPRVVIHCAAENDMDKLEFNPDAYEKLNVTSGVELAKLAGQTRSIFVFLSTDNVFSGENPPYGENCPCNPINQYGLLKAKAEKAITEAYPASIILRIPVVYGGEKYGEPSWVSALIRFINSQERIELSNVERMFPSHSSDIANIIFKLVQKMFQDSSYKEKIFQWCGTESYTMYTMAVTIAEAFGKSHEHLVPLDVPLRRGAPKPRNLQMSRKHLESLGIGRHTPFINGIQEYRQHFL